MYYFSKDNERKYFYIRRRTKSREKGEKSKAIKIIKMSVFKKKIQKNIKSTFQKNNKIGIDK